MPPRCTRKVTHVPLSGHWVDYLLPPSQVCPIGNSLQGHIFMRQSQYLFHVGI